MLSAACGLRKKGGGWPLRPALHLPLPQSALTPEPDQTASFVDRCAAKITLIIWYLRHFIGETVW